MRRRTLFLAVVVALIASACGATAGAHGEVPYCDNWDALILEAQSVPSAELLPCVEVLPLGWTAEGAVIDSNGTTITLDSDRAGARAVVVKLRNSCDVGDATVVASDEPGTTKLEHRGDSVGDFKGRGYYRSTGSCTTYEYDFGDETPDGLITEASAALTFISRDAVNAHLLESSGGRLEL